MAGALRDLIDQVQRTQVDDIVANRDEPELWTLAKLAEEVGEVCAETLVRHGAHRRTGPDQAGAEIADVIMCAVVLACLLGVDLEHELDMKLEAIAARFPRGSA